MIHPLVHLNGTSRDALRDQFCDVGSAIMGALRTLESAGPNARDYYPLPDGDRVYKMAVREHMSRVERLKSVYDELLALAEGLDGAK